MADMSKKDAFLLGYLFYSVSSRLPDDRPAEHDSVCATGKHIPFR